MKKFVLFFAIVLTSTVRFKQLPQSDRYQVSDTDNFDLVVTNNAVGKRISILSDATPVYAEAQTPITNTYGLATIEIVDVTTVAGSFAGIDWSNGAHSIRKEPDALDGTSFSISRTNQ